MVPFFGTKHGSIFRNRFQKKMEPVPNKKREPIQKKTGANSKNGHQILPNTNDPLPITEHHPPRIGSGQIGTRKANFCLRGLFAGTLKLALGTLGPEVARFFRSGLIRRNTRTGSGKIGARHRHVLIRGLFAGTPELVPARLAGPDMALFLFRAYQQGHRTWFWPDWGPKSLCF